MVLYVGPEEKEQFLAYLNGRRRQKRDVIYSQLLRNHFKT
jgi:hypothetical protein